MGPNLPWGRRTKQGVLRHPGPEMGSLIEPEARRLGGGSRGLFGGRARPFGKPGGAFGSNGDRAEGGFHGTVAVVCGARELCLEGPGRLPGLHESPILQVETHSHSEPYREELEGAQKATKGNRAVYHLYTLLQTQNET